LNAGHERDCRELRGIRTGQARHDDRVANFQLTDRNGRQTFQQVGHAAAAGAATHAATLRATRSGALRAAGACTLRSRCWLLPLCRALPSARTSTSAWTTWAGGAAAEHRGRVL